MQTIALNRLVYFCWAAGGNMCLTSVSLARRFAVGLHCPLHRQWPISKSTGNYSAINELTFEDSPAHWRLNVFVIRHCLIFNLFVLLFIRGLLKKALDRSQQSKHTHTHKSVACPTPRQTLQVYPVMWGAVGRNLKPIEASETWRAVAFWAGERLRPTLPATV